MKKSGNIVVLITTADEAEAGSIAAMLLERRLAACSNIVPRVKSVFRWQGKAVSEVESLLIVKSTESRLPEIVETVNLAHSYELPEIIALPAIGGGEDYLNWIAQEVG